MQMLLDAMQAAALATEEIGFRIDPTELSRLAREGRGPCYRRLDNGRRLYEAEHVRQWAASRLGPIVPTRDAPNFPHGQHVGRMQ